MDDTASTRLDPVLEPISTTAPLQDRPANPSAATTHVEPQGGSGSGAPDQLARVEEKTARIEEKFARTEALLQRVEAKMDSATGRMAESARQADLSAVREQVTALSRVVRNLPGLTSLVAVAIVTSLLTSAITLALMKYGIPGLLPR